MAPWDPPDAPLTPWDPKTGLLASLNSKIHLNCFTNHQKTHKMLLLILSDILPLPLDPLGPPGQIHALVRFRGKSDGDDANDGGGSVADRGFMTRGLLAVP